jgi:hypothetical protein
MNIEGRVRVPVTAPQRQPCQPPGSLERMENLLVLSAENGLKEEKKGGGLF